VFILMFIFTSWLFYKKIKDQNCCMTCDPNAPKADGSAASSSTGTWSFPSMPEFTIFWNWLISEPSEPPKKQCSKAT